MAAQDRRDASQPQARASRGLLPRAGSRTGGRERRLLPAAARPARLSGLARPARDSGPHRRRNGGLP